MTWNKRNKPTNPPVSSTHRKRNAKFSDRECGWEAKPRTWGQDLIRCWCTVRRISSQNPLESAALNISLCIARGNQSASSSLKSAGVEREPRGGNYRTEWEYIDFDVSTWCIDTSTLRSPFCRFLQWNAARCDFSRAWAERAFKRTQTNQAINKQRSEPQATAHKHNVDDVGRMRKKVRSKTGLDV